MENMMYDEDKYVPIFYTGVGKKGAIKKSITCAWINKPEIITSFITE